MKLEEFKIGDVEIGLDKPLFLMAGPCVIEDENLCMNIAKKLLKIKEALDIGVIFKASFDKANRSSVTSFRGPGLDEGLEILDAVRQQTGLPIMTDIHEPTQAEKIGQVVDCIQIPAFLCRQTDLLCETAKTGKAVNIKKGQFVSPAEMKNAVEKVRSIGNDKIMLTERGTFFGYNRLVNDMTAIEAMKQLGCPVVFDATHSTQQPGGFGNASAGQSEMAPILAKAAIAAGANGLFFETHPDPKNAKCDAATMIPIDSLGEVITKCNQIFEIVNS